MLNDFQRNFEAFKVIIPFVVVLDIILRYSFGVYNSIKKDSSEIIYTSFITALSLTVGIMGICFFIRDVALAFPRSVILLNFVIYFILLTCWYLFLWFIFRRIHGVKKIIIIGKRGTLLTQAINREYSHLYQIEKMYEKIDENIENDIENSDEVFVLSDICDNERERIVFFCMKYNKNICFVPKYSDLVIMSSSIYKTDDIPTYRVSKLGLSPEEQGVKRVFDLILGLIAFILFLPVGLIVALLIKLDGGPIFYTQERLTRDGKIFKILKFRTMVTDAEKFSGPVLTEKNDSRITKLGRFMRAVRLDEIPQLINILKGEMSIVGPRPERPFFVEQFEKEIPQYSFRLKVKAGLTGLAQVEGKYNTSMIDKLRYDLIYIHKYSLFKDFLIIIRTIKILFMKSSTEGIHSNQNNHGENRSENS
jgi:exopolysaccharide biosynthesis polyprenyl glycosylphosphotransferase